MAELRNSSELPTFAVDPDLVHALGLGFQHTSARSAMDDQPEPPYLQFLLLRCSFDFTRWQGFTSTDDGHKIASAGESTCTDVLFDVIDPSPPYWEFGLLATCLIVLGADFTTFTSLFLSNTSNFTFVFGTLFIAKVSLPHEQSVAAALFQVVTQIGSAIGVSVPTSVFNSVLRTQSRRLGIAPDAQGDNVPLGITTGRQNPHG
ncbi:hypothetical protein EDB86DRAFT_3099708 [Lactarius hatsudake]|nr:hypothetical protein EDB86DRAFT_3099708 [Lactarius hatsudake]